MTWNPPPLTPHQRAVILGDPPNRPHIPISGDGPPTNPPNQGSAGIPPQTRETRAAYWQGYTDALIAADKIIQELGTARGVNVLRRALRNLIDHPPGSDR